MKARTLEILALLVVALAVLVLVDRPAPTVQLPDRLLPGFAAAHVVRLRLVRGGRLEVELGRAPGGWTVDGAHPADEDAVNDFLGTLEYLAFRRRVPAGTTQVPTGTSGARGLAEPRLVVEIHDTDGAVREVRIGAPEPLLGRTWVSLGGADDFLVDDYAVRALDRRAGDFYRRTVFGALAAPKKIVLATREHEVVLDGTPPCVELAGGCAAADRARAAALRDRIGELSLSRFLHGASIDGVVLRVAVDDAKLAASGAACPGAPDERQVSSSLANGCLPAAALAELARDAVAPEAWVETSPLTLSAGEVDRIEVGALVLERAGGGWRRKGGGALDGEAVRGWLQGIASFRGRVVPLPRGPLPAPAVTLAAGDTVETLALLPGPLLRRNDEPVALAVHPGARALLAADPTLFADRSVLSFEPSALAEIIAGGPNGTVERAVRGATAESFALVAPAPLAVDGARLAELRDLASHLRAQRVVTVERARAGLAPPRRTLTFVTDPPVGESAPGRHVVELGAANPDGTCQAARGGEASVYVLGAQACATLEAPLASRRVFELAPDEATSVSAFGVVAERHGGSWYAADGTRLDGAAAAALGVLVRQLAVAPAVVGYGALGGGTAVVLGGPNGATIALHVAHGEYALDGRPVRYKVAEEVCRRWAAACR